MFGEKLNEIFEQEIQKATQEMQEELESKTQQIKKLNDKLFKIQTENDTYKKKDVQIKLLDTFKGLINKENFEDLVSLFDLKESGVKTRDINHNEIPIWFRLLIKYYPDRETLFALMDMFNIEYHRDARNFVMPYEYNQKEVSLFLDNLKDRYIANGCIYDDNMRFFYDSLRWNEFSGEKVMSRNNSFHNYIPWQLFLKNPLLIEENNFNKIIKAIEKKVSNSNYFFQIQDYQQISLDQAKAMFQYIPMNNLHDVHKRFIENNKNIFGEIPELALQFIDKICDNQWSTFYYVNYPVEIQKDFVRKQSSFSTKCNLIKKMKITKIEKLEFLKEFTEIEFADTLGQNGSRKEI